MITTAGTIETVIENSLLSVLKQDSNKTQSARQIRGPSLNHNSASPGSEFFMVNPIPHTKVSTCLNLRPCC
jgi:hypothetical protein